MERFTPVPSLLGGVLIGLAASLFFLTHGKVAGISGLVGGLLRRPDADTQVRLSFVTGLLAVGVLGGLLWPTALAPSPASTLGVISAGVLVGFGTRLGNGCTSGHGVCGLSRFSLRSLVATVSFIAAGALAVALLRLMGGRS